MNCSKKLKICSNEDNIYMSSNNSGSTSTIGYGGISGIDGSFNINTNSNINAANNLVSSNNGFSPKRPKLNTYASSITATTSNIGGNIGAGCTSGGSNDFDDATRMNNKQQKSTIKAYENLKQMLVTESNEEINKKDSVYAYNFYEKVEETLKESNPESFNKFQKILRKFDPKKDRVADLYNKIENLFLPEHPDLVQIFLTFLLPSQAAEIGKFFEYFMLTNMTNFVNKLNIYFSKQPSQIKKVYTTLNELSDETNLTMEKIKTKLLPLLKGNQFLTDWFLQMFPTEEPPKSLGVISENISAKQLEMQTSGHTSEFISHKELVPDSPEHQSCQIRYINGRIFYGSRILLPAKLAFIAKNLTETKEWQESTESTESTCDPKNNINENDDDGELGSDSGSVSGSGSGGDSDININNDDNNLTDDTNINYMNDERLTGKSVPLCVHDIRTYAEKIIKSTQSDTRDSCNEGEKSEDEDHGQDIKINYEICDDVVHKQHAIRLNPSLYSPSYNYSVQTRPAMKYEFIEKEIKSPKKPCLKPLTTINVVSIPHTSIASLLGAEALSGIVGVGGGSGLGLISTQQSSSSLLLSPPSAMASAATITATTVTQSSNILSKDKRKSPVKKTLTKSPGPTKKYPSSSCNQSPVISITVALNNETTTTTTATTAIAGSEGTSATTTTVSSVIKTAKKLKAMLEEDDNLIDDQGKQQQVQHPLQHQQQRKKSVPTKSLSIKPLSSSSLSSLSPQKSSTISIPLNVSSDSIEIQQISDSESCGQSNTSLLSISSVSSSPTVLSIKSSNLSPSTITPTIPSMSMSMSSATSDVTENKSNISNSNWTRLEDKIILEEVKLGFDCELNLANRLKLKLSNRGLDEILQRHQFLMDVLSKLQNRN